MMEITGPVEDKVRQSICELIVELFHQPPRCGEPQLWSPLRRVKCLLHQIVANPRAVQVQMQAVNQEKLAAHTTIGTTAAERETQVFRGIGIIGMQPKCLVKLRDRLGYL